MTIKSDLLKAMDNEAIHNITLIGSDGQQVSASKTILAIRSPIFERMFFGKFQERTTETVPMDYPGVVLQVAVKYCYTDEMDLDLIYFDDNNNNNNNNNKNNNSSNSSITSSAYLADEEAVAMVQLRDAANYLGLYDLHKALTNELAESILYKKDTPQDMGCVCAILQELMARGGVEEDPLWSTCIDLVETFPKSCLLPTNNSSGIVTCTLPLLEKLFGEPQKIRPLVAAQSLQKWYNAHKDCLQEVEEKERATIFTLASKIDLETISFKRLGDIATSELFSAERLLNAFRIASKKPQTQSPTSFATKTATVFGAGVECANGVYQRQNNHDSCFILEGNYGGEASKFYLVKVANRWVLRVASNGHPVHDLYETESSSNWPSYCLWNSVDGDTKAPTPCVSLQQVAVVSPSPEEATATTGSPAVPRSFGFPPPAAVATAAASQSAVVQQLSNNAPPPAHGLPAFHNNLGGGHMPGRPAFVNFDSNVPTFGSNAPRRFGADAPRPFGT